MTALVKQRTRMNCAICCMAMLTGRDYDDVMAAVGDAYNPVKGMRYDQKALKRLGFTFSHEKGQPMGGAVVFMRGILAPDFFLHMAWGRRALISVPSLNYSDSTHMVFCDGERVFDPSPRLIYVQFYQLKPDEVVLFQEAGGDG